MRVGVIRPPKHLDTILTPLPAGVNLEPAKTLREYPIVLLFCGSEGELSRRLPTAAEQTEVDGALWVCWPKKSSPLFRDLTEDGIRAEISGTELVDVKVCAVDSDWSGLKLMVRREARPSLAERRRASARKK